MPRLCIFLFQLEGGPLIIKAYIFNLWQVHDTRVAYFSSLFRNRIHKNVMYFHVYILKQGPFHSDHFDVSPC